MWSDCWICGNLIEHRRGVLGCEMICESCAAWAETEEGAKEYKYMKERQLQREVDQLVARDIEFQKHGS